jgi:hypothetical protein
VVNSDGQVRDFYPVEYINSIESSGITGHLLQMNKLCIVLCLRDVIPEAGFYNGTRLVVNDVRNNRILRYTIINGSNAGEEMSFPRIKLRPQYVTNQPCELVRFQFPARLACAITINKS